MTKGQNSKNSLKALAHPVQRFLGSWGVRAKPSPAKLNAVGHDSLPAPYELAALRGEGVLRDRFFNQFIAKLPVALEAEQQIATWQSLVEDGGYITAWAERLGIAKAMRREATMRVLNPDRKSVEARKLYTLLLDTLARQAPELLPGTVEGYFWHCWKQQFPSANDHHSGDKTTSSVEILRERLVRILRKQHGNEVEIRESFTQTPETVLFAMLWRASVHSPWQTLHQLERPRLKTARLAVYGQALDQITAPPICEKKLA